MSLFSELKRRNVFRVAVAYIVASWLVLQVVDVVQPILKFPDWVAQLTLLILVLGFVAAIIISWAYEITPEGIRRDSEVDPSQSIAHQTARKLDVITMALLVVAIAVVVFDRLVPEQTTDSSSRASERSERDPGPISSSEPTSSRATERSEGDPGPISPSDTPSLAVLPFANMSPDPDNEYFADGISEELLNLLVKVKGLRVPSRTSSFAFKGQNRDIRDIASELQVGHVLEGSVRKAGNRVRITAQLIDVSTDTHLWSETYDRELEDIFAIQGEISAEIVNALHLVLGMGEAGSKPTENLEAYNLYLQGRFQFQKRGESLYLAQELLSQAVSLDPEFAEAWAYLALTHAMMPNYVLTPLEEAIPLALDAADRAAALDPDLAEPGMVQANAATKRGNMLRSLEIHEENVRRHPDHVLARVWYAITLLQVGYLEESREHLEWAYERDPASALVMDWLARTQAMTGDPDLALRTAQRAIEFGRAQGFLAIAHVLIPRGDYDRLIELLPDSLPEFRIGYPILIRHLEGQISKSEAVAELEQAASGLDLEILKVVFYQHMEDYAELFDTMNRVLDSDTTVITALWWPHLSAARQNPQMKSYVEALKIPDIWRSRGWPDLCRPVDEDGWECD